MKRVGLVSLLAIIMIFAIATRSEKQSLKPVQSNGVERNSVAQNDQNLEKSEITEGQFSNFNNNDDSAPLKKPAKVKKLPPKIEQLFNKIADGDNKALFDYLDKGGNPNVSDEFGNTPLSMSSLAGDIEAVDYLLKSGADLEATNEEGRTPLMMAIGASLAEGNYSEVIEALIESGANINSADHIGQTALHFATQVDNHKLVESLMNKGALPTPLNDGTTPAQLAISSESNKSLVIYMNAGMSPNDTNEKGQNLAHLSILNDNDAAFRILVSRNVNLKKKDHKGNTPLDLAIKHNNNYAQALINER